MWTRGYSTRSQCIVFHIVTAGGALQGLEQMIPASQGQRPVSVSCLSPRTAHTKTPLPSLLHTSAGAQEEEAHLLMVGCVYFKRQGVPLASQDV